MNLNQNLIEELRNEIYVLKLENNHLKMRLQEVNSSWVHPNSCLHNEDLWKNRKT
jgi:regulator of replication initiation timing